MADAREEVAAQAKPNEFTAAFEIEATYFEFQLAAHAFARDKAELRTLLESGYSYEVSDAKGKVARRERVAIAKRKRMLAVAAEFAAHPSSWIQELAATAAAAAGGAKKLSFPNRSLASENDDFANTTHEFLKAVAAREFLVVLRWECLRDLLGGAAVNDFVRDSFGFRELGPPNPVPPVAAPNPADIIVVGGNEAERAELATMAVAHGFTIRLFEATSFLQLGERAQELRGFLTESPGAVSIVSFSEGTTIVRNLLDQFSTLRTDGTIRAWINVNGELYGKNFADAELDPTLPGRAIASAMDTVLRARARTDILLGFGQGFAIVSLVGGNKMQDNRFELFHAAFAGGDNYIYLSEAGAGAAAVEAVERAISAPPPLK